MISAWHVVSNGELEDVVQLHTLPEPQRGAGEVLVEVHAASLGFPDMLLAKGLYHDRPEFPFALGAEAAGIVIEAEPDAGVKVGDRVIVVPGQMASGLLLPKLTVPADRVHPIPDSMSMLEAGGFTTAYQTSYIGLVRRCHLVAGETLLVLGASGGIGSAAVELGKALGATVIAVARGGDKAAFCRELGADHVIDSGSEDLIVRVKELTEGHGADVIFDPIGGAMTDAARRCIALEGRLLIVGFASAEIPTVPVNHALLKNYSVVGYRTWPFRGDRSYRTEVHKTLFGMYERGELRPRVEEIAHDEVVIGLQRLADRQVTGRLVVNLGGRK